MSIVIDQTHLGRRASGIERVTRALLSPEALAPLPTAVERTGASRLEILAAQAVAMPLKGLTRRRSVWVFPGFPPSPGFWLLRHRVVLYVHDLFLLTRGDELNFAARAWLAPNFARALKGGRLFLTNSETTARELRGYVAPDAEILTFRPPAENVFALRPSAGKAADHTKPLVLGAIGTLEPRKNFIAAARIAQALSVRLKRRVTLHIVGRRGWGGVWAQMAREEGVVLHGYLADEPARDVIEAFDALICTSHAEGLCLPLLEAQFAGLPVIAPDQPVFREVLGESGAFINPEDPIAAAQFLAPLFADTASLQRHRLAALANTARWNALAAHDRVRVQARLARLLDDVAAA